MHDLAEYIRQRFGSRGLRQTASGRRPGFASGSLSNSKELVPLILSSIDLLGKLDKKGGLKEHLLKNAYQVKQSEDLYSHIRQQRVQSQKVSPRNQSPR